MSSQEDLRVCLSDCLHAKKPKQEHRRRRPSAGQEGAPRLEANRQRLDPGRPAPAARVDGCCLCSLGFLSWQLELRQVTGVFKYVTEGEGSCSVNYRFR